MHTLRDSLVTMLILCLACSTPAFAQERHIVDRAALAKTVEQHAANQDADRAAIRQALARPEVQTLAKQLGIDVPRVNSSVAALTGADLERAASAARQVNDSLAGGASNVTISTTTIIIILLALILLIVAIKA